MKSKTIILSSQNNSKGRGILTLFQEDNLLQCRLRLYNTEKLTRFCKIGVYHNNEVTSANLLEKNGAYASSLVGNFDIDQDFYTAIIDTQNDNNVILSGGTYAGFFFNDESVFENKFDKIEKANPTTNLYEYPDEITNLKEPANFCNKDKTNEQECEKCAHCKYKEFFYSNQNNLNIQNNELATNSYTPKATEMQEFETNSLVANNAETLTETDKPKTSILENLVSQFKYVFENYEADETLNNLISNSRFVKINENNNQYSIGAIYETDEMKYICYAVMCSYNTPAPQELGEHYQWLPLDKEDPLSEGYYIVFQDANDLKIVEL